MTWMMCMGCQSFPCVCNRAATASTGTAWPLSHTHYHFTPHPLSDADIERIAKKLAELLKEKP